QFGIVDKLKHGFKELTLQLGSYLEPMEPVLAGMTAMGPIMMALSTAATQKAIKFGLATAATIAHTVATVALQGATAIATAAQWAFNVALSANPIGIVIIAITALVAAGIALYKNWDTVVKWAKTAWEWMVKLKDTVVELAEKGIDFLKQKLEDIIEPFAKIYEWISKVIKGSGFTDLNEIIKETDKTMQAFTLGLPAATGMLKNQADEVDNLNRSFQQGLPVVDDYMRAVKGLTGGAPGGLEPADWFEELALLTKLPEFKASPEYKTEMRRAEKVEGWGIADLVKVLKQWAERLAVNLPELAGYQHGTWSVPRTGPAIVHQGETIIPSGGLTIQLVMDGEIVAEKVINRASDLVHLQGAAF
ncbi:hypothetical protein KKE60_06980, partial [Patescibacteria group bacterium]|nr:hypothetical protein [Patescibacteria group bacterium]